MASTRQGQAFYLQEQPLLNADRPTVVIIGAGFSGVMTAIHLLREIDGPYVRLLERRDQFGLGAAYSTRSPLHLLNVRATNMSAFPDRPTHFTDWLSKQSDLFATEGFVTRAGYGRYLRSVLREALETCAAGRFLLEPDAAIAVEKKGGGWRVELAGGRRIAANAVVLAVGNLPPSMPTSVGLTDVGDRLVSGVDYIPDPWAWDFDTAPGEGTMLLLGTGLTAIDVALELHARFPKVRLMALSRRGLVPRRHGPVAAQVARLDYPMGSVVRVTRALRKEVAAADWRGVIDRLRPHVQTIWREWSVTERRRFLRHAQPWWDVHRHRLSPPVAEKLEAMIEANVMMVRAGRLSSLDRQSETGGLVASWTPRGTDELQTARIECVINCTGPNGNIAASSDPLIAGLYRDGLIRPDPERLGVDVDRSGRLIDRDGLVSPSLFALGPIARGQWWEITSVPDIRLQAVEIAASVVQSLHNTQHRSTADHGE